MPAPDPLSPVWIGLRAFTSQQGRIAVAAGIDLEQLVATLREHSDSNEWQNAQDVTIEEHARWFQEEGLALLDRGYALQTRLWGQAQLVLSAAGNVSKALWPSPRRHRDLKAAFPDRVEQLRAYFGVEDDSPLADLEPARRVRALRRKD